MSSFSFLILIICFSTLDHYSALIICILALNLFSDFLQHRQDYIFEYMERRMLFSFFIEFTGVENPELWKMQYTIDSS